MTQLRNIIQAISCCLILIEGIVLAEISCKKPGNISNGYIFAKEERFNSGSRITFTCESGFRLSGEASAECQNDGSWSASNPTCVSVGKCTVMGDPHYYQFDNEHKMLDFMGKCTYLLSATRDIDENDDRWFSIETRNEERYNLTSVSYLRSVKLSLRGGQDQVVLNKDTTIMWNDQNVGMIIHDSFECRIEGQSVFCSTKSGLRISFDGHAATLEIPDLYRNKVHGICGNFNGDDSDDLVMESGETASDFTEFAESYETVPCGMKTPKVTECSAWELTRWEAACEPLKQHNCFECSKTVDPTPYYDACVFDQCATNGDQNELEAAFAKYAQDCLRRGIRCCNWRACTGVPVMNCPSNSYYQGCGSPCPKTCTNPTVSSSCKEDRLIETCVCRPGYLLEGNKCVLRDQCGCITNDLAYPQGEKLELSDLGSVFTCEGPNRTTQACMKGYRKVSSESKFVCEKISCGNPSISNGYISPDNVRYDSGSTVKFICDSGFRRSGAYSAVCQNDGSWSSSKPTCIRVETCPYPYTDRRQVRRNDDETCNVMPGKENEPCTYLDCQETRRYADKDEELCKQQNESCCWDEDTQSCHQRMEGTGEIGKKGKQNPFKTPKANAVRGELSRSFPFGGICLPKLPFPGSCKYKRNEPYVLNPPTNVPYCVRLPCSLDRREQQNLDNDHFSCGSQPGCYFDAELNEYRNAFGPAVLPGVPVCHFAIRNAAFHREAQKVVERTGSWNPYFTNCLLKTFDDDIRKGPEGCKLMPLLKAFKIYPKLAGWDGITSYECALIDGCFSLATGCVYPVDINNIVVKSGQRFKFDRFEVIYGRPKCQHFNMENSYEILKSYHRCLSSGCSVDLDIVSKYYHYLYDIGNQMSPEDHWDYWDKALGGKLKPDNLDEGIHWEWDRSFKRKAPVEPPVPSSRGQGGGDPPAGPFNFPGRRKRQIFPPPPPPPGFPTTPVPEPCGFVYRAFGGRPCRPPQVPNFQTSKYCPYKPFKVPKFPTLKGSFKGCCDINYCYLSIRDIRKMHSGPATYYTEWSAFSECSRSCGGGTQKRTRFCITHDESKCTLKQEESRSCNNHPCPRWGPWSRWGPCPGRCGLQQRTRHCIPRDGDCRGKAEETRFCNCPGR